jgi:hypothetical protein
VPAALLAAVRRDLAPVRPLASPVRRALALLPIGIALLIGIPMFWAWHRHVARPIAWPAWGWSALETAIGLTTLAAGFREAIPGRELSRRAWAIAIGLVALGFLVLNATGAAPTADVSLHTTARWIGECITEAAVFSLPALAVAGWLVARALPMRPRLTGAVCGLGVGMMADAGLRLFCWDGDVLHIVVAHGGAIAIVVLLGALSARLVERRKALGRRVMDAKRSPGS